MSSGCRGEATPASQILPVQGRAVKGVLFSLFQVRGHEAPDHFETSTTSALAVFKIVSFSLRYLNCNFMIPTSFLPTKQDKLFFYGDFQNDDSPFVKAIGINELNAIEPGMETILYKLDEQNSPYRNLPDLVEKIADGKSTVDLAGFVEKPTIVITLFGDRLFTV